jgi:AcrR family transcriptional regulator
VTATQPRAAPTGPRSPKGARTRARLVQAAKEIFAEHGLPDARIVDITERAGVAYGSFYNYFDSKEELFREIAAQVDGLLRAPMDDVILARHSDLAPEDRIREAIRRHYASYREEAGFLGAIEQAARLDGEVGAARARRHHDDTHLVAKSIRALQRHGLADPHLDATVAAAALGGMTYQFAELWLAQGGIDCDFETAVETITRLYTNALGLTTGQR